ncbi:transcriptional regulator [Lysinibacillus sp. KCTC 33748]|uniref:PLDc N-terminal domain-containing protein n=1 Tax=unclassified Lysinibacillus TaxID=2636778 RepID=UPI0009A5F32C|nr:MULTISPECIES: PLD nuclease N-terminal domain-containing protein [unclassified Lysinibacillus]OXS70482.1 transcriptional regulator [Lysinibacillus sp. KCTC 33748]SKC01622.1 Phospholipase_D-nuclease N-terminal [Lysinibacillus sp. AC-3]
MMEELAEVPWAVIAPLIVVQFILMIIALVDLRKIHATNGPKILWVFLIIFTSYIGSIAYFIVGRKQS